MENQITRNWWVLVVRGIAACLFGVLAYLMPGITLASLVLLFGIYAVIDGVFAIASAMMKRSSSDVPWWVLLLQGIVGIGAGVLTFMWPGITAMSLLYMIAAWSFVTGMLQVMAAIRLRKEIKGEWLLGLAGVLSIALGVVLVARPAAGALALVWMIGAYALVFGVLMIVLGFRLRSLGARARDGGAIGGSQLVYR